MHKILPTNDLLFKKILTSEDSTHILKAFVKDLLGIEFKSLLPKETYHIDSYRESYAEMEKMTVMRTEVDILAIAEDGSYTTIECQIQPHSYFHERSIFYLVEAFRSSFGSMDKKEIEKQNNFSSLRPAYGINVVDFHLCDKNDNALRLFRLLDEESYQPFLNREGKDLLMLCFLSLKNQNINKQQAAYHWQYFFKTGDIQEEAPEYIKEAKIKVDFLTLESEEKEMIMNIEKSKAISDAVFATAREEGLEQGIELGIEQGIEQGIEKEKYSVAIKLLKLGDSVERVVNVTGLDVALVEKMKREQD